MHPQGQLENRDELLYELGLMVDPIRRVLDDSDFKRKLPYLEQLFRIDRSRLVNAIDEYCNAGGFRDSFQHSQAHNAASAVEGMFLLLNGSTSVDDRIREKFKQFVQTAKDCIRLLPCEHVGAVLPATSPMDSFRKLVTAVRAAKDRVDLFDPYLDADAFLRYMHQVDELAKITVVTDQKSMKGDRGSRIVSISELMSIERPDSYQLRAIPDLHDRYLRIDNEILHLGGSVKDAGKWAPYTISRLDPTSMTHAALDALIASGDEWYGPHVKPHRAI